MKAELERTGRSWRPRFAFAALAALGLAQASAAAAANGTLGYPCGETPSKPSHHGRPPTFRGTRGSTTVSTRLWRIQQNDRRGFKGSANDETLLRG